MSERDIWFHRALLEGRWSASVPVHRPKPVPTPTPTPAPPELFGMYDTVLIYDDEEHFEEHQLWLYAGGCAVYGVPVHAPRWSGATLAFADQADASREAKPWAAQIDFRHNGFTGWCEFPGEGRVGWNGRRIGQGPPFGEWETELFYGGAWQPEAHPLHIGLGLVSVAGERVVYPRFTPNGLQFHSQPRASRAGLPELGEIHFTAEGFEGSCQFPGEGGLEWRGHPAHPPVGQYRTMIGYGGQWFDEAHPLVIAPDGVSIAGVPLATAKMTARTLDFTGEPDATHDAKPWAGHLDFAGETCTGWCQFPGEGRVDWRGELVR